MAWVRVGQAAALLLLLAGCSRTSREAAQRIAILSIDNLSGDASLDWVAAAAPRMIAAQLTGAGPAAAIVAGSVSDAYAGGATRFLEGYFDRRDAAAGAVHFEFRIEDAASHHMQEPIAIDGPPLEALDKLAHRLDPAARPFSSSNPQAIEAFGRGDYERAVAMDPDFSAAWLAWAQFLAPTDEARATDIIERALAHSGLRSAADRSRLQLLAASLTHDPEAELRALEGLQPQPPSDPNAVRTLAETAMNARQFARAANYYRMLARLAPSDLSAQNLLGYAYAFAGDLDSAMKAYEIYRREPGQEANALDSIGEAYFINGKFADAERFFLQAHEKDASMLGGGDLLKAAYARWLSAPNRDLGGADALVNRFGQFRAQAKDPLYTWKEATWLFATGRPDQARAELETTLSSASPQLANLARKQLAAWKAPPPPVRDLALMKRAYQSTPPASDGLARTFYAAALLEAGQKEEARKLIALWPLPDTSGDPVLQAFLYPKFLELREKLK